MTAADVLIVGGGPVGLDLACRLALDGISVKVLERATERRQHSRSIGIHSPSLEILAEVGVSEALERRAIRITKGRAFSLGRHIGNLTLDAGPPPFQYVLAIPQSETEAVLEDRLEELAPESLVRGARVTAIHDGHGVSVECVDGRRFQARFLVGCDGQNSTVRRKLGIDFPGGPYPDTYAMGDFRDDTDFGPDAAIFLTRDGLVESFPLPGGGRRWVVRTEGFVERPDPAVICDFVARRTGHLVEPTTSTMVSGFRVYRHLAERMAQGRVLLAGDAAHVVSPIGGQGMNLGWLDGKAAARVLREVLGSGLTAPASEMEVAARVDQHALFAAYSRSRRASARRAARRAEFNMRFGRPSAAAPIYRMGARLMLAPPFAGFFARQFTMRGL